MDTSNGHQNYMNGISYFPDNPITRLMMVGCSFFLGEKGYYNPATKKTCHVNTSNTLEPYLIFAHHGNKSKQQVFYETVNLALEYDFGLVLEAASKMRHIFMMRKSPMAVFALAAAHPKRVEFNEKNPGVFRKYIVETCVLPGDMVAILDAWKSLKGSKSGFPSFVKRAMADRLSKVSAYQANKYRKACIDCARISHPKSNEILDPLMKEGKLEMKESSLKWETLRSQGKTWIETLEALKWRMPHMAALRNLRGFAVDVRNTESMIMYCHMLLDGVEKGKQFPFRYYTAYQQVKNYGQPVLNRSYGRRRGRKRINKLNNEDSVFYPKKMRQQDKELILETLEECIQKSIKNHPKLKGDVIVLSDNSGSAHGCVTSTYGSNTVAEIGNLSALMTAMSCTGRGTIGLFGDKLLEYEVSKDRPFLEQFEEINELAGEHGRNVGGGTENGIWLFFKRAFQDKERYKYDHFFCYSDMQAGHGGLYGCDPEMDDNWLWKKGSYSKYIHVPKLLEEYRRTINPRLSAFMVQTAGYDDSILPQSTYRGAILTGWTGNEVMYASNILDIWDSQEVAKENTEVSKSSSHATRKKKTKPQLVKTHLKPEYLRRKKLVEEKARLAEEKVRLAEEKVRLAGVKARESIVIKKLASQNLERKKQIEAIEQRRKQHTEEERLKREKKEYELLNEESMINGPDYVFDVKVEDKQRIRSGKRCSHKKEVKKKNTLASKNMLKRKREKKKNEYKLYI